jgi:hypothetical protein
MDTKALNLVLAKVATDYFIDVFKLEVNDEEYKFHIYNLALVLGSTRRMPEDFLLKYYDSFLQTMESFPDRFKELLHDMQQTS